MKPRVYKAGSFWYTEAMLLEGRYFVRYHKQFKTWGTALQWALNPTAQSA